MALSDACFEFVEAITAAARRLTNEVEHYDRAPFDYGEELDALRRACAEVVSVPWDAEAGARLVRLASSVMAYHDTPPGAPNEAERKQKMARLIELLRSSLDESDAREVVLIMPDVVSETPRTEGAALRLKRLLPKLGKTTYDVVVKIITDIASETTKKILGL